MPKRWRELFRHYAWAVPATLFSPHFPCLGRDGSFVTDKLEPNDVDCVLLIGPDFPRDALAEAELLAGLPFINLELVVGEAFQQFTEKTYATDRNLIIKGMIGTPLS